MAATELIQADTRPQRRLLPIIIALMMAVSLAALDSSIVVTAAPKIVGSLGGLELFGWVFSVNLLTATVMMPVYGKLADLYGRKPILIWGVSVFLVGSALCGLAQSMEMLIACRALVGFGTGAVMPATMTIIGDTFSIEQRAKMQGFFSGVWGVTALAGPLVGGIVTDEISWRWIFFVTMPLGVSTIILISRFYSEDHERRPHRLDIPGALLLAGSVVCLLLVMLQFGRRFGWTGPETLALLALSAALMTLFVLQERRAAEPMVPLSLFKHRVIIASSLAVFLAGGLSIGIQSYVPLFEQGVNEGSATRAGLILAPMSISWIFGAMASGRMIIRLGFFPSAVTGGCLLVGGAFGMLFVSAQTTIYIASVSGFFMGIGMGFMTNACVIAVQNTVEWEQRGIATASTQFFRSIGGSIAVAMMGALLNGRMADRLADIPGVPPGETADALLTAEDRAALPAEVLAAMQNALSASLHEVFFIVMAAAALALAAATFFPRGKLDSERIVRAPRVTGPPRVEAAEPGAAPG
jgi:EmrB/QacA subfamily drug resistance transporter